MERLTKRIGNEIYLVNCLGQEVLPNCGQVSHSAIERLAQYEDMIENGKLIEAQTLNTPLTIKELKSVRINAWVWVEYLSHYKPHKRGEYVKILEKDNDVLTTSKYASSDNALYWWDAYGSGWWAYRTKPTK